MRNRQVWRNHMKKESHRKSFLDRLELPEDIVYGDCLIHMTGTHEIRIENYRSLCHFDENQVLLLLKKQKLCIYGDHLEIPYYFADEIRIMGNLKKIEFISERGSK